MNITSASMEIVDRRGSTLTDNETVNLDGNLELTVSNEDGRKRAEIRRYVTDKALAKKRGQASSDNDVMMDWFMVYDVDVSIYSGSIRISGYMSGAQGHLRDGVAPVEGQDGNPFTDDDQPLVRVQWYLR